MSGANRIVDGVLGGWSLSGIASFNTGQYLRFGGLLVSGDPSISDSTKERAFDTSKFQRLPAFTRRTNPVQYDGVKGMRYKNVDLTLAKKLPRHRTRAVRAADGGLQTPRTASTADLPSTSFGTSAFGSVIAQRPGYLGRQLQYSGRFTF